MYYFGNHRYWTEPAGDFKPPAGSEPRLLFAHKSGLGLVDGFIKAVDPTHHAGGPKHGWETAQKFAADSALHNVRRYSGRVGRKTCAAKTLAQLPSAGVEITQRCREAKTQRTAKYGDNPGNCARKWSVGIRRPIRWCLVGILRIIYVGHALERTTFHPDWEMRIPEFLVLLGVVVITASIIIGLVRSLRRRIAIKKVKQ